MKLSTVILWLVLTVGFSNAATKADLFKKYPQLANYTSNPCHQSMRSFFMDFENNEKH